MLVVFGFLIYVDEGMFQNLPGDFFEALIDGVSTKMGAIDEWGDGVVDVL